MAAPPQDIKGTCLCGAVELSTQGPQPPKACCSCTSCQACSGSVYTVNMAYTQDKVTVTKGQEHIRVYKDKGDSGGDVLRHFCGVCGNGLFSDTADGNRYVKAPVLNALESLFPGDPVAHIYRKNLPKWADGGQTGNVKLSDGKTPE